VRSEFALTEEEQVEMLPSGGSTYIYSRTGWAMTFLTKGELIEKVVKATYRATNAGREFLKSHPETITLAHLENDIPGYAAKWKAASQRRALN
jgi:restriction system protein